MMRAFELEVRDAVWQAVQGLIGDRSVLSPRGRPRVPDFACFTGIYLRLVTGLSWTTIEWMLTFMGLRVSDTTLRARRDEWIQAGVFDQIVTQAWAGYDRVVGFDLDRVALDGSNHLAPGGGPGTGVMPMAKGRLGYKWSIAVDTTGVPLAWVLDAANRHDYAMLEPTLELLHNSGIAANMNMLCLDRGYGYNDVFERCAKVGITNVDVKMRRKPGEGPLPLIGLGHRWIVEAANSWLSNYGQLRRSTDRKQPARTAAFNLAITILLTTRLIDWRNTWHQPTP